MPLGAALVLGGIGAAVDIYGQNKAASAAEAGQAQAAQLTREQLAQQQKQYEQLLALSQPYREAGTSALQQYQGLLSNPSAIYSDPTYQAMLAQGTKALEGSAAARGTQLSGRTLAGLQDLGMSTASQYRAQIMNELGNLINTGSTSIGQAYGVGGQQMSQIGGAYGNLANLAQQTGQLEAAGALGQSQGITGLLGTLGSAYIKKA